ncbi:MAG: hypothetical protein MJY62_04795 [Bacteroidales bacterium]|nr:hypothetical protein [Bacteroidales bacterium]
MERKMPYNVPEGYFETLDQKMMGAVAAHINKKQRRPVVRLVPYFAFTAVIAVMVVAGTVFLRSVTGQTDFQGYDQTFAESTLTDEDILNYLIDSGCSTDYFAENL